MNYKAIYDRLIARARIRAEKQGECYERHHVVPRCLSGGDEPQNLVLLTPEEHYLAHQLLTKIHPGHKGLIASAMYVTSRGGMRVHGWLRRQQRLAMLGENHPINRSEEVRRKNQEYMRSEHNPSRVNPRRGEKHHFFGKTDCYKHSEAGKQVMSEQKKGEKNPFYGAWGWRHPTCTEDSKKVWARADEVLKIHQANPKMGYSRVSKVMGLSTPFAAAGVLAKIKEGWNPLTDAEWKEWKSCRG